VAARRAARLMSGGNHMTPTLHRAAATALLGLLLAALPALAADPAPAQWKRGIEHQRQGDLGNGTFLNPVLAGDRPDPSVLKDGEDY